MSELSADHRLRFASRGLDRCASARLSSAAISAFFLFFLTFPSLRPLCLMKTKLVWTCCRSRPAVLVRNGSRARLLSGCKKKGANDKEREGGSRTLLYITHNSPLSSQRIDRVESRERGPGLCQKRASLYYHVRVGRRPAAGASERVVDGQNKNPTIRWRRDDPHGTPITRMAMWWEALAM